MSETRRLSEASDGRGTANAAQIGSEPPTRSVLLPPQCLHSVLEGVPEALQDTEALLLVLVGTLEEVWPVPHLAAAFPGTV